VVGYFIIALLQIFSKSVGETVLKKFMVAASCHFENKKSPNLSSGLTNRQEILHYDSLYCHLKYSHS